MKKPPVCAPALLVLALAALASPVQATLLNIDFGLAKGTAASSFGGAAHQAGTWNGVGVFGNTALADTSGTFSPGLAIHLAAGMACSGSVGCGYSGGASSLSDTQKLVNDNFFASAGQLWSLSIFGLDNGLYDVFYYAPSNTLVSTGSFTVNGVSQAAVDNPQGDTTALVLGVTHGLATGIWVNQGVMTFQSASTLSYRGLAGLQLVSAKNVPEPGTLGLVAVAFAVLLGWGAALRKRVV